MLRVLSENAEHCAVSTLGIAFGYQPKLVRSVSGSMHHLLSKQTMHLILTLVNVTFAKWLTMVYTLCYLPVLLKHYD